MRKLLISLCIAMMGISSAVATNHTTTANKKPVTIAVLAPVEIPAMNEIIAGFKQTLSRSYHGKIHFIVKNAQGDANLQRTILQQFNNENVTIVAPIGTVPAEMAMTLIKNKPIVAIAADYNPNAIKKARNNNIVNLQDDPSPAKQLQFIHAALPNIKSIALIHSDEQRMMTESAAAKKEADTLNINLQLLLTHQLYDVYTMALNAANDNNQAIYILQDEGVLDGLNAMVQQAEKHHIPVIASDDGSVQKGAAFALGISQHNIGVEGAKLVLQVLNGSQPKNMATQTMNDYTLYINPSAAKKQKVDINKLQQVAKKLEYSVVVVK